MSNHFKGVTFANQNVTPSDDAVVMRHTLTDGILTGCGLTYSGHTLTMAAGYLIACGRLIHRPSAENWAITGSTSGFARVVMTIDLTRTATVDTFDQVNTSIEYADRINGFQEIIQEDINAAGVKYQVVLAVVSLGSGGITGIASKIGTSNVGRVPCLPIAGGTLTGPLICNGQATFTSPLSCNGQATFTGPLIGNGQATLTGPLICNGQTTLNGILVLNSNNYGDSLPAPGIPGRIYFKKL